MIETIDTFLGGWIEDGEKHYDEVKRIYIEFLRTGEDKNPYKNVDKLKNLFGNKKLGIEAGRMIRNSFYCNDEICNSYNEYMKSVLTKEAARKKAQLEAKIEKEVGNIKNVSLMIGVDGSLNGFVEGDNGKVTVTTIGAGGYNIQRYHYRVLVKRI